MTAARVTRIEHELEELRTDVRILLRAQVLQTDQLDKHESRLDRIDAILEQVGERLEQLTDRVEKLVSGFGAFLSRFNPGPT